MKRKMIYLSVLCSIMFMFTTTKNFSQTSIIGQVVYHNVENTPLEDVTVILKDSLGIILDSKITLEDGKYHFDNLDEGTYNIEALTSLSPGGIDMEDAYLIELYLNNLYTFTTIQKLAADVDGDGAVTWDDHNIITDWWFLYGYPFPVGDWVFETLQISVMGKDSIDGGMDGSSTGDVDGVWEPGDKPSPYILLEKNDIIQATSNEEFEIEIKTTDIIHISGMGLIIDYPGELVEVEGITSKIEDFSFNITDEDIRISWIDPIREGLIFDNNEAVITLKLKTTSEFVNNSSINLSINSASHLLDKKGKKYDEITFNIPVVKSTEMLCELNENYPNPFNKYTNIEYKLADEGNVSLKIFDINGKEVACLLNDFQKEGIYKLTFDGSNFNPGTYIYKIDVKGKAAFTQSKMMVISK